MLNFIGIGTGRSGTSSLAHIVAACANTCVSHEGYPSDWYKVGPNIGKLVLKMRHNKSEVLGEVSCNLLPHIQHLRGPIPDLRVVCLHRNKSDVVKSFMANVGTGLRPGDRPTWKGLGPAERLPIIDAATSEQSWEFYWEYAEELMRMVKEPVLHMQMLSLNDDFSLKELFDFLDIPTKDVILTDRRIWNSSKETVLG